MAVAIQDQASQMNTYRSYVSALTDPNAKDETKLRAVQDLSENLEVSLHMFNKIMLIVIVCFNLDHRGIAAVSCLSRTCYKCVPKGYVRR